MTHDTVNDVSRFNNRPVTGNSAGVEIVRARSLLRAGQDDATDRDVKLQRGGQLLEADTAVAHLTADETQIELMQLRTIAHHQGKPRGWRTAGARQPRHGSDTARTADAAACSSQGGGDSPRRPAGSGRRIGEQHRRHAGV